jgi:hypothetical protein
MIAKKFHIYPVIVLYIMINSYLAADISKDSIKSDGKIVVTATGQALIQDGDEKKARDAAKQAALNAALEDGIGMYITSKTHVENMQLIQQIIVSQTGGLAALKKIVSEKKENGYYKIQAEVWVSPIPLISVLRQNGILREWRVMVVIPEFHIQRPVPDPAAETEIIRQFILAGFKTVDPKTYRDIRNTNPSFFKDRKKSMTLAKQKGADILITGEAFSERSGDATGSLMSGLVGCNARVEVKAIALATGEIIFSDGYNSPVPQLPTSEAVAAKKALQVAAEEIAGKLVMAVSLRPASLSRPKIIEAGTFPDVKTAALFQKEIAGLPGVKKVHREQYDNGHLMLEVDVNANEAENLDLYIETKVSLPGYRVNISAASRNLIRISIVKK